MISVVIATADSEQALAPTLAALVPGAMAGLIREVIVADASSQDGTAMVADAAGCRFLIAPGNEGGRLRAGAAAARSAWLMFLRPGAVLEGTWIDETERFLREIQSNARTKAAVFRRVPRPALAEAVALIGTALGARPHPEQGLLIPKPLYDSFGGHRTDIADAEKALLRQLGRRRITRLRSAVGMVGR